MPYDFIYTWNLKHKTNKQNRLRYREHTNGDQMCRGLGSRVKKVKGLNTNWQLQSSHRDVKYSTRNVINNIIITMCGAR